jgi:hypothetical protein
VVRPWAQAEITFLDANRELDQEGLATALGRTRKSVRNKLWRLGMTDTSNYWTATQIDALRQLYSNKEYRGINVQDFAEAIGKDKTNVCRKARQLGLTNKSRVKRFEDLSEIRKRKIAAHNRSPEERQRLLSEAAKKRIRDYGHPRGHSRNTWRWPGNVLPN